MKIVFPSYPSRFGFPFRIFGYAGRYDTLTGCAFLNDSHIVCADRQMAALYLLKFNLDMNCYTILDKVECIIDGVPQHVELICIREHTVYSVGYSNKLFKIDIVDFKFTNMHIIEINKKDSYHGVNIASNDSVYVTNMKRNTITEFNVHTHEKKTMFCEGGVRMKAIATINEDYILALSSNSGPTNGTKLPNGSVYPCKEPYDSHLLIYNCRTALLMDTFILPKTQIDGCAIHNNHCYVTCTDAFGVGYILRCKITPMLCITEPMRVETPGFPHGVSIHNDILAYTSYSDSSLHIHKLDELNFTHIV